MYSGTDNRLDMTFDTFKKIVDDTGSEIFELQLEGGEPLIFGNLYLFIEYAIRPSVARRLSSSPTVSSLRRTSAASWNCISGTAWSLC